MIRVFKGMVKDNGKRINEEMIRRIGLMAVVCGVGYAGGEDERKIIEVMFA